jgi:hypothetical protein
MKSFFGSVVFLDRVGTKGIWKNKDPEKVVRDYEAIMSSIKDDLLSADKRHVEQIRQKIGVNVELKLTAFSDTIIITFAAPVAQKDKMYLEGTVNYAVINLLTIIPLCISLNMFLEIQ